MEIDRLTTGCLVTVEVQDIILFISGVDGR